MFVRWFVFYSISNGQKCITQTRCLHLYKHRQEFGWEVRERSVVSSEIKILLCLCKCACVWRAPVLVLRMCLYEWEWGPTFNVEVSMRRRCRRSLRWGSAALRRNDCLNSDWPLDSDPRPRGQTPPCSHARNRSPSEAPSLPPSEQSEGKQRPAHLMLSWTLCFTSVTGLEAKRPGSALSYISDQPLEDSSTPRHIYDIV